MLDRQNELFDKFLNVVKASEPVKSKPKPLPLPAESLPDSESPMVLTEKLDSFKEAPKDTSSVGSEGSDLDLDMNDNVPLANKLSSGESSYDWDFLGAKDVILIHQGSALQVAVDSVHRASDRVGKVMGLPCSTVSEGEDLQSGLLDVPSLSNSSQSLFPIPESFRKIWDSSRKSNTVLAGAIVPPVVRRSYKLPPED